MGYCVSLRPGVLKDVICFFPIQLLFSAAGLILGSVKCVDLSMYTSIRFIRYQDAFVNILY